RRAGRPRVTARLDGDDCLVQECCAHEVSIALATRETSKASSAVYRTTMTATPSTRCPGPSQTCPPDPHRPTILRHTGPCVGAALHAGQGREAHDEARDGTDRQRREPAQLWSPDPQIPGPRSGSPAPRSRRLRHAFADPIDQARDVSVPRTRAQGQDGG